MSYAIHPYAISVAAIKKCVGSYDARLLKKLNRQFRNEFGEIDELDEDAIPVEQALSHLVMGGQLDERSGFKYGYALKFLCEYFGKMLTNECWSSVGWDWIEEIDNALADVGVDGKAFRVDPHLTTRGAPIPLPPIADFPAIGYLLEGEMADVVAELEQLEDADNENDEIRDSIDEARKWFNLCSRTHKDLVCFYH